MSGFHPAHAAMVLFTTLTACGIAPPLSPTSEGAKAVVAAEPAQTPSNSAARPSAASPAAPPATQPQPAVIGLAPTPEEPARPPDAKAAPKPPAKPAPSAPAAKAPAAAKPAVAASAPSPAASPAPPSAAAAPALDLKSLEQRIKETDAIGLMTKLTIKNQVDDLVGQFRTYHDGRRPPTLPELRRPYEMLLMKLLALLQDKDPGLAKALHDSREAIWGLLSDRDKFSQLV